MVECLGSLVRFEPRWFERVRSKYINDEEMEVVDVSEDGPDPNRWAFTVQCKDGTKHRVAGYHLVFVADVTTVVARAALAMEDA